MLRELLRDFDLNEEQINKLNKLREICIEYNKHVNLTSIVKENEFNIKHILDSMSILNFFDLNQKKIIDVGSGGGFPGLVIAIIFPESEIIMLDSNNKKIKYIDFAIKKLKLRNASTIKGRIEEQRINELYDIVLSRAVAPLNILLEITANTCRIGGYLIYYKGDKLQNELPNQWNFIEKELGIKFNKQNDFKLDDSTIRKIISFKKIKSTRNIYPRDYAVIKKSPLY